MRRIILTIIIVFYTIITANAQTLRFVRRDSIKYTGKINLDSTSVVVDSAGAVIPYNEWQPIIASGQYRMRFTKSSDGNTVYTLYTLSAAEKDARFAAMPKPTDSKFFKTGEKIPSFVADDINGNGLKLKKLQGKIVVLNFWFIGCPPCRTEIPELNKLALSYANDPDVVFISIGLDSKYDIENFLKYSSLAYHVVDNGKMYADMYGINLYPTNVVLDKEGKVRFHTSGYSPNLPYWIKKTIAENK